ncbi:MAG: hypothetical protein IJQ84_01430 [Paludibacteraceae bacterium]|nr:hypothetical protein [Paludibacteraceae bacterium]
MTFTEAKQRFDSQYGTATEFTNFLPEHFCHMRSANGEGGIRKVNVNYKT